MHQHEWYRWFVNFPQQSDRDWLPDQPQDRGALTEEDYFKDENRYHFTPDFGPETGIRATQGGVEARRADRLQSIERQTDQDMSQRQAVEDKIRATHALCGQLELTDRQREYAVGVMEHLDLTEFGTHTIEEVALAAINVVVEYDRAQFYGPEFNRLSEDDRFKELARKVGLDSGLMKLSRKIKDQLKRQAEGDKIRAIRALSDQLELTDHQRKYAVRAMNYLDLTEFGTHTTREVALATISVVAEHYRPLDHGPEFDRLSEDDRFKELAKDIGLDSGLMKLSGKIKEQLNS